MRIVMKREVEQQWKRQKDSFERRKSKEEKEEKASRSIKDRGRRIIERSNSGYWTRRDWYIGESNSRGIVGQWYDRIGDEFEVCKKSRGLN